MRNALTGTLTFSQLFSQLRDSVGRQVVLRVLPDRFLMIPERSPRFAAIEKSEEWSACVVGIFTADVSRDVLLSEVM